jgi:hypothetical protein
MSTDSKEIFENYIRSLNEAKMPKGTPRPDVIDSKQHLGKTTIAANPDMPEAHGATIGRNSALTPSQSDRIRDKNFESYKNEDIEEGYYIQLTGEGSRVSKNSQKQLMKLMREYSNNKYFKNEVNGNLVIPYWIVPDCIQYFTIEARSEEDPKIKQAYINALIVMYEAMSDKSTYEQVYRNSKPVLRIKSEGGKREVEELRDTFEEFSSKIVGRVKTLKLNPTAALSLKPFLFHNHTKPRQQVKFGSDIYEDAVFLHAPGEGGHTIFGKTDSEPRHDYDGTDPTYGVSSAENLRDSDFERIHIKNKEQRESTPTPARSLGAPKAKKSRKPKKVNESFFIKDIPF